MIKVKVTENHYYRGSGRFGERERTINVKWKSDAEKLRGGLFHLAKVEGEDSLLMRYLVKEVLWPATFGNVIYNGKVVYPSNDMIK